MPDSHKISRVLCYFRITATEFTILFVYGTFTVFGQLFQNCSAKNFVPLGPSANRSL